MVNKMPEKWFIAAFAFLITASEKSEAFTVEEALRSCQSANIAGGILNTSKKAWSHGICAGALRQASFMMKTSCNSDAGIFRSKIHPSIGAAWQAFQNWAEDNPQQWNIPFEAGVVDAISQTFPCQRN